MKIKTHKICANPECKNEFKLYRTTDKYCSIKCQKDCAKPIGQTKKKFYEIPKVSKKRKVENLKYSVLRTEFLGKKENKICFIEGCNKHANTIEHSAGRKGFYDEWARDNNISLYLDVRFWQPCCQEHNLELENNSEMSKKYQLSKVHGGEKG